MQLGALKTPSLILDPERVRLNAERMTERVRSLGVRLRPHVKTHKCVEVARLQTAGHSGAITVSTLAEARAFAARGFTDILYAVPLDPGKFAEVIDLAKDCECLSVITCDRDLPAALEKRLTGYEHDMAPLLRLVAIGVRSGDRRHDELWTALVERFLRPESRDRGAQDVWVNAAAYPALLLTCVIGVASVASSREDLLYRLLCRNSAIAADGRSTPVLRAAGSIRIQTSANCPAPPVCFL